MGKGEIARDEQFLLSPQFFLKACFPEASKGVIVWEWVNGVYTSFGFAQNTIHDFRNTILNSWWHSLQQMPQKVSTCVSLCNLIFTGTTRAFCVNLYQAALTFNPFPNKPLFSHVCSTSLLKTLCEKEKLLVTSNFSFLHSVFNPFRYLYAISIKFEIVVCKLFQFERIRNSPFGKGINLYHEVVTLKEEKSLLKTLGETENIGRNRENACSQYFVHFLQ